MGGGLSGRFADGVAQGKPAEAVVEIAVNGHASADGRFLVSRHSVGILDVHRIGMYTVFVLVAGC